MSDTRKTWDEVVADLPDNAIGLISAADVRNIVAATRPHVGAEAPTVNDDTSRGFDVGNKWINGANLYECMDATIGAAVWVRVWPPPSQPNAPQWGEIEGTLSGQTDLSNALAGKASTTHNHDDRYYTETEIDALLGQGTGAADGVTYSNSTSGLAATDVQAAIDELADDVDDLSAVSGLTNPLVANLDANDYTIIDAGFRGLFDVYYDLDVDSEAMISDDTASLSRTYNAYMFADLGSALEIDLPNPGSVAPFGTIAISLGSGGSVTIGDAYDWAWEKTDPDDADPTIPTEEGTAFRIRYSYDPIQAAYMVSLSYLGIAAPPTEQQFTYNFQTQAETGHWDVNTNAFITGAIVVDLGDKSATDGTRHGFLWIPALDIPKDATIVSATLVGEAYNNRTDGGWTFDIHAVDHDDFPVPASYSDINGAALTTAKYSWVVDSVASGANNQTIPGFGPGIQELVERSGWVSGNSACLVIKTVAAGSQKFWQLRKGSAGVRDLLLTVTYTA